MGKRVVSASSREFCLHGGRQQRWRKAFIIPEISRNTGEGSPWCCEDVSEGKLTCWRQCVHVCVKEDMCYVLGAWCLQLKQFVQSPWLSLDFHENFLLLDFRKHQG